MPRTKTLSSDFYHSSSVFNQETESIFKNEWLWVARSEELSSVGSYITTEIMATQLLYSGITQMNLKPFTMSAGIGLQKLFLAKVVSANI